LLFEIVDKGLLPDPLYSLQAILIDFFDTAHLTGRHTVRWTAPVSTGQVA